MKPLAKRIKLVTGHGWYCPICNKIYNRQSDAQACCKEQKITNTNEHWLKDAIIQEKPIGQLSTQKETEK